MIVRIVCVACLVLMLCVDSPVNAQKPLSRSGAAGANPAIAMCDMGDLSLNTDDEGGTFHGMSQDGTLLVLRNIGPKPCRVDQRPPISFLNGTEVLPIKLEIQGAKYMHPGPVLVPVIVVPGAEVTSTLHWVAGPVYEQNQCFTPTALAVAIGGVQQRTDFGMQICGDQSKGVTFNATPLAPDLTYDRWLKGQHE